MLTMQKRKDLAFIAGVICGMDDWKVHARAAECSEEEMNFLDELIFLAKLKRSLSR